MTETAMKEQDPARAFEVAGQMRVVIGQLKRQLRAHAGMGGLSWSQTAVLSRLEREGPATVSALARAEGVRSQSMGATVAALEAAGLVQGTPDPADGRQTVLALTAACVELIAASRAERQDWLYRAIRARLSANELDTLAAALPLLARLAD